MKNLFLKFQVALGFILTVIGLVHTILSPFFPHWFFLPWWVYPIITAGAWWAYKESLDMLDETLTKL